MKAPELSPRRRDGGAPDVTDGRTPRARARPRGSLRAHIARLVDERLPGQRGELVDVRSRPSPFRSTHALEELALRFADGSRMSLLLKAYGATAAREARGTRPRHAFDPYRELWAYENLLAPLKTAAPRFYGTVSLDPGGERLVLERVGGRELYQVGEFGIWEAAARWLARLHRRGSAIVDEPALREHLLVHDAALHRRWLFLARRRAARRGSAATLDALERLRGSWERAIAILERRPRTVLHGEFYASNVLAERGEPQGSIRAVDWEWIGLGPGELDLAALTAGSWPEERRRALEGAYARETGIDPAAPGEAERERALWAARLVVAIQWLGWADEWTPPPEHAHDWLAEADRAGARLRT